MGRWGAVIATTLVALLAVAPAWAELVGSSAGTEMRFSIGPDKLPAHRPVPVSLQLGKKIAFRTNAPAPIMTSLAIELGPTVIVEDRGLPACPRRDLRGASAKRAMARCGDALVGHGNISFGSDGRRASEHGHFLAFNGQVAGRPAILLQVGIEGTAIYPGRFTIAFESSKPSGLAGPALLARMPEAAMTEARHFVAFDLTLRRNYGSNGRSRGFIEASCPAAPGEVAEMTVGTAVFGFAEGRIVERPRDACRATR